MSQQKLTPFEDGRRQGQWTDKRIIDDGFRSVEDCLIHQERSYRMQLDSLKGLAKKNPVYAAKHAEFLDGIITGIRESLGEGYKGTLKTEHQKVTPFEKGRKHGCWTAEKIADFGFSSAKECLAFEERVYRIAVSNVNKRAAQNPTYAAQHAEYLKGVITGARESLRGR